MKEIRLLNESKEIATPIQRLDPFQNNNMFIKRDDLFPFSLGGNKSRKAVYFYREIMENGYDSVVTCGRSSSNHCRVIANMCAAMGIPCYIVSHIEDYKTTQNSKMMEMFRANIEQVEEEKIADTINNRLNSLEKQGYKPLYIIGGGHGNNGTQAYVDAYYEIMGYEKKNHLKFDYIILASGTGTTQAGLVCGQILNNVDNQKIIGISIAREQERGRNVVMESVKDYLVDRGEDYTSIDLEERVIFDARYRLNGYGSFNEQIKQSINDCMVCYGIAMDTTYVGKAYWAMQQMIREDKIEKKNILFIHTGGTPLFFDFLSQY